MIKDAYGNTRFYGVYRGVVYDNADPNNKNRVRLKVPQVLADQPTEWAWPVETPGVTTVVPEIGQGIWVMFEGGDLSYPIWMGQFGNKVTAAATPSVSQTVSSNIGIASFTPPEQQVALDTNYAAFEYTGNQAIASATTAYVMPWNQTDMYKGVYTSNTSQINFRTTGVYNLQWSGQFENSNNAAEDIYVWLRVNGTDVPGTAGKISIPARKDATAGNEAHMIIGWNYFVKMAAGSYLELVWSATNTTVSLKTYAASTSPTKPSAAAILLTVSQVA